jgi:hypothetical protein
MYQGFAEIFPLLRPYRTGMDLNRHFAVKQFNSHIVRMREKGRVRLGVRAGRYCPAWTGEILKAERENRVLSRIFRTFCSSQVVSVLVLP